MSWHTSSRRGGSPPPLFTAGDGSSLDASGISQIGRLIQRPEHTPCFVPENYCLRYAYPLVCYLHDDERSEQDFWNWFPAISDQNFLGIGVRAPFPHPRGYLGKFRWRDEWPGAARGAIQEACDEIGARWNVHPDRVFLFGEGRGAVVALQQFLISRWDPSASGLLLGGVICRHLPRSWARLLPPLPSSAGGRILFLDDLRQAEDHAALDGLNDAGVEIAEITARDRDLPASINHWLMSAVATAIF